MKPPALAKTRLELPAAQRHLLTLAMAADVIAVAAAVCPGQVGVIGDDAELEALGVPLLPGADGGLSAAVIAATRSLPGPVAVLAGDLPAIRADELTSVLAAAELVPAGVVSDTPGSGTTMLTARSGGLLHPSYGEGSFGRHLGAGATDLGAGLVLAGLRRDVDTLADLAEAVRIGVGAQTRQVMSARDFDAVHLTTP